MNKPTITEAHRKAAEEWVRASHPTYHQHYIEELSDLLARHFPAPSGESVWHPISEPSDGREVVYTEGRRMYGWRAPGTTHWAYDSDILRACPLPKELTPEEQDEAAWEVERENNDWRKYSVVIGDVKNAFIRGRRSAREQQRGAK